MTVTEIKKIAKEKGVSPGKMSKGDLVRTIQNSEGFNPCFDTGVAGCPEKDCLWFADCQK